MFRHSNCKFGHVGRCCLGRFLAGFKTMLKKGRCHGQLRWNNFSAHLGRFLTIIPSMELLGFPVYWEQLVVRIWSLLYFFTCHSGYQVSSVKSWFLSGQIVDRCARNSESSEKWEAIGFARYSEALHYCGIWQHPKQMTVSTFKSHKQLGLSEGLFSARLYTINGQ